MRRAPLLFVFVIAAQCAVACKVELKLPDDVRITCAAQADCPQGFDCRAGQCILTNADAPPTVTLLPIARALDTVSIALRVVDIEGAVVSFVVEARPDTAADFVRIVVTGDTSVQATAQGVDATLSWSAAADLAAMGRDGYVDGVQVRVTPQDPAGLGPASVSEPFAVGNDPPVLTDVAVDSKVSGNTVVRFRVADSSSDPVRVALFEVSRQGDFSDAALVTLAAGAGTDFPGGSLTDLRTSPEPNGVWHNVTWDSSQSAAYDAAGVRLRVQVADAHGAASEVITSALFEVDNASSPPELEVTPQSNLSATVTGDVVVNFRATDADGDLSTLFVAYSLDAATWFPALSDDTVVGLTPGLTYPFTWQVAQLDPGVYPTVWLRFTIQDNQPGDVVVLGPFALDTTASGAVDTSPPNYISPVTNTVFTDGNVFLQWTSRLGASSYTLEVASDAAFASPISGSPFTVSTPEHSLQLTEDITYYWRVRANVTAPGAWSNLGGQPARFDLLLGALYVYCANAQPCTNAGAVGNKGAPYRTIDAALTSAQLLGISEVRVAARGGGAAYSGIVFLRDGVSVLGGYDAAFSARDPVANETIVAGGVSVAYASTSVVAEGIVQPTTLSGFTLRTPAGSSTYGMRLFGTGSGLVIDACTVQPAASSLVRVVEAQASVALFQGCDLRGPAGVNPGDVIAVSATNGSALTFRDSVISSGDSAQDSLGMSVYASTLTLEDSSVTAGAGMGSVAVDLSSATFTATDSQILAGLATDTGSSGGSVGLDSRGQSAVTIVGGAVYGGASPMRSQGVRMAGGTLSITGAAVGWGTITGPNEGTVFGLNILSDVDVTLSNTSIGGPDLPAGLGSASAQGITLAPPSAGPHTLSIDHCSIVAAGVSDLTGFSAGVALSASGPLNTPLTIAISNTLVAGGAAGLSYGMYFFDSNAPHVVNVSDSIITSGEPGGMGVSVGLLFANPSQISAAIDGSLIAARVGPGVVPLAFAFDTATTALSNSVIFIAGGTAGECLREITTIAKIDPNTSNAVADCPTYYHDNGPGDLTSICAGNFGNGDCSQTLTPAATGVQASTAAALFGVHDPADPYTWSLEAGWPATLGVDPANVGPP